jgi:hypothetical protein
MMDCGIHDIEPLGSSTREMIRKHVIRSFTVYRLEALEALHSHHGLYLIKQQACLKVYPVHKILVNTM